VVVSTCGLSRTAIRVLSLWCSGCCQVHILYISGPLSYVSLEQPLYIENIKTYLVEHRYYVIFTSILKIILICHTKPTFNVTLT
jgi:hypothetical protein